MSENKENEITSVWDDGSLDEIQYIKFEDENDQTVAIRFLEDNPTARKNKFNVNCFDFEVLDMEDQGLKTLSVTSKRLMRLLREHLPLDGKAMSIQRTGSEMETDYLILEVKE